MNLGIYVNYIIKSMLSTCTHSFWNFRSGWGNLWCILGLLLLILMLPMLMTETWLTDRQRKYFSNIEMNYLQGIIQSLQTNQRKRWKNNFYNLRLFYVIFKHCAAIFRFGFYKCFIFLWVFYRRPKCLAAAISCCCCIIWICCAASNCCSCCCIEINKCCSWARVWAGTVLRVGATGSLLITGWGIPAGAVTSWA